MAACDPVVGSGAVEAAVTLIVEWVFTKGLCAIDLSFESAKTLRIIITAFNRFSGFAGLLGCSTVCIQYVFVV